MDEKNAKWNTGSKQIAMFFLMDRFMVKSVNCEDAGRFFLIFRDFSDFRGRLPRLRAAQGELRDATHRG